MQYVQRADRLIVVRERDVGLFSLFLQVVNTLQAAEALGTTEGIVVLFREDCAYFCPDGFQDRNNVWDYYFEPINPGLTEQTLKAADRLKSPWVVTRDYYPGNLGPVAPDDLIPFETDLSLQHRLTGGRIIEKYIRVRPYLQDKIDAFYNAHMAGHYVIGAHVRGTDMIRDHNKQEGPRAQWYVGAIERRIRGLERQGIEEVRIFAASDDQASIDFLRDHFGERIIDYGAIRKVDGPNVGVGPTGDVMPAYITGSRQIAAQNGEEVVAEYSLLCRCQYLVHNISSISRSVLLTRPLLPRCNVQPYA